MQLVGQAAVEYSVRHGVTMVMVTDIKPGMEAAYRAWADRIQKLQATFPGYIGSFVQPPQHRETGWTTVLRFDSAEHLDGWLKSEARAAMVKESEALVQGFHAQRVDTSFPGWVAERSRHRASRPICGRRHASFCSRSFQWSCWNSGSSIRTCARSTRRCRHLHRQCDQRGADHLAADSAGHLWLPRLAVSREPAALAGDGSCRSHSCFATRSRSRCSGICCCRDLSYPIVCLSRARSDGVSTSAKMPEDATGTSRTRAS